MRACALPCRLLAVTSHVCWLIALGWRLPCVGLFCLLRTLLQASRFVLHHDVVLHTSRLAPYASLCMPLALNASCFMPRLPMSMRVHGLVHRNPSCPCVMLRASRFRRHALLTRAHACACACTSHPFVLWLASPPRDVSSRVTCARPCGACGTEAYRAASLTRLCSPCATRFAFASLASLRLLRFRVR